MATVLTTRRRALGSGICGALMLVAGAEHFLIPPDWPMPLWLKISQLVLAMLFVALAIYQYRSAPKTSPPSGPSPPPPASR